MTRRLRANRGTPRYERGLLAIPGRAEPIAIGGADWLAWLAAPEHTTFYVADGPAGCTARCERRRGGRYWYAYARHNDRLRKIYLGRAADLNDERLRAAARRLHADLPTVGLPAATAPQAAGYSDLLSTKLMLPPRQARLLMRPRLTTRLDGALGARLALIVAPAGYGKTSLLVAWLAAQREASAWLALDAGDDDPARFWRYLLAAVDRAQPALTNEAQLLLNAAAPIEAVLTSLLNQLVARPASLLVLALDDYHLIDAAAIHSGMAFLLDHAPPNLHVVLAARAQPPLPLARLRARGQLAELGAADLRLTATEIAAFFRQVICLDRPDRELAALARTTEGWAVAVQLAVLSLQQSPGASESAGEFDHSAVLDYLADEVFAGLSAQVQAFLLDTAILERFCAPLCDAIHGDRAELPAEDVIAQIERAHLFVVPLDAQRRWFRYHQLFASFLRARLRQAAPERICMLHSRAARWFARERLIHEAVGHALAAGDFGYAAGLIRPAAEQLVRQGEVLTLRGWLAALPAALVRADVDLSLWYAWTLVLTQRYEQAGPWLAQAGRRRYAHEPDGEHAQRLGQVAVVRATIAAGAGDLLSTIQHAQGALALLPRQNNVLRAVVALNLGTAYIGAGDLAAGAAALEEAQLRSLAGEHTYIYVGATYLLAQLRLSQGWLLEAARICRQAQAQLAAGGQQLAIARISVVLSAICCERDQLAEGERLLGASMAMIEQSGYAAASVLGCITLARICWARGQFDQAHQHLDQAALAAQRAGQLHELGKVEAYRARIWLAQGQLAQAERWQAQAGLALDQPPAPGRAAEWLARAEQALASARERGSIPPEMLLAGLAQAAEQALAEHRRLDALAVCALLALAQRAWGDLAAARALLSKALALAESEGATRTLAELGAPLAELIEAAIPRQARTGIARRVMLACLAQPGDQASAPAAPEPLTRREREVLALLAAGLADAEIAHALGIAVGTARWHTKRLLGKLGVANRTQAALLARERGLC